MKQKLRKSIFNKYIIMNLCLMMWVIINYFINQYLLYKSGMLNSMAYFSYVVFLNAFTYITVFLFTLINIFRALKFLFNKRLSAAIKNISFAILIILLGLLSFRYSNKGYLQFMNGFETYVNNQVNIALFKNWIQSENLTTNEDLPEIKWPEFIKTLNPDQVVLKRLSPNDIRVRLIWFHFVGDWGFEVSHNNLFVSSETKRYGEFRKKVSNNCYIWHELR